MLVLCSFDYRDELIRFPLEKSSPLEFAYNGGPFLSCDSEYLYCFVRKFKSKRILEVGSDQSALMVRNAIEGNEKEKPSYSCEHICIDPYEADWLDSVGIRIIREKVESLPTNAFTQLSENDILFIDSSHVLRPQGDVLFRCQEILPILESGVLVHIRDIFTLKDYLDDWILQKNLFWNEQYLLEAFLCLNSGCRVVGAVNFLKHHCPNELRARLLFLTHRLQTGNQAPFGFGRTDGEQTCRLRAARNWGSRG